MPKLVSSKKKINPRNTKISSLSSEFKVNTKSKFGWCLTGHHKTCIVTSVNNDICACDCHG